jgi:CheY-like chemotaxis protein
MTHMPHIMLVDDDDEFRLICTRLLQRGLPNVVITPLERAYTALETLANHTTDLLITNHQMPEMTGLALIGEVRARGYTLPILMISGSDLLQQEARQAGATRFLTKQQAMRELVQVVEELLGM